MEDDRAFIAAFESATLPNSAFHHRDHVRLAWLYLRRDGPQRGTQHVLDGIRHFATAHGVADRFHVTLTLFWVRLVQHLIDTFPMAERFEDLLAHYPRLTDKSLIYQHYTRERLALLAARQAPMEPDVLALPF